MDAPEIPDAENDPLNRRISIIVAISATFLSVANVKDGNVVQAMQQAQADSIDTWGYFQAKSTKQHVAEATVAHLEAVAASQATPNEKIDALIAKWKGDVTRYEADKKELQEKAQGAMATYNALNVHDDQFDMCEASLSLAIALMGITALTRQRWLLALGMVFAGFGVLMGVAGFAGWGLHPDIIAGWLS
jgi:hypothetical protein